MVDKLVECIPNFSEARRSAVVDSIIEAIQSVPKIRLLDRHSDLDHNRTVLTFIGPPDAVEEAAYQAIAKAAQLIDLNFHQGEHPRIGATDVVPFVPISGVSMVECVEMSRRLGKRVADSLNIPVYLYEEAAVKPERKNLEEIRRGQFEGLKEIIASDPLRQPDFGPTELGPAGATVIGARHPLIAYNVYLTSDNVSIAEKIARRVRNSSGGFRYVKAMGVLVEGLAQVSMNLTNYKRSPMAQVTEMIRREAQRYGVSIHHTEIVGLVPNQALIDAAQWYLQADQFEGEQLLESRIFSGGEVSEVGAINQEASLVDALADGTPTPGGGSASAYAGAMAAALVAMVGRLTVGKAKYAAVEPEIWPMIEEADKLRHMLSEAVQLDADAYTGIIAARRLPKETEALQQARSTAIYEATIRAAEIPLQVAQHALQVMRLAVRIAEIGNLNALSDAGAAVNLANAALKGAALNVRINCLGIETEPQPAVLLSKLAAIESEAPNLLVNMNLTLKERSGLQN